ncbi:SDR family oxidoreductase [Lolliginicoccus suaedae]|uniref:SDR family oxidoreductase n=1 Tax=Lolliginicoccus suaedae TaxID=2605429 RepID=UPI0011EEFF10|nr:SDR family oxidoreductase [Lolliginicoccus suaedae]
MADSSSAHTTRCLVTGATGYIGGRLAPRLIEQGNAVRVLARTPEKLRDVPWAREAEIVQGDLTDIHSLEEACQGIDVIYYLVHSMGGDKRFADTERQSALNLVHAAEAAGVQRIIYLGGLHPSSDDLSPHLRSRAEVGDILLGSTVPTIVLQAGVVIGSGSASFEMIRHLTDRLPVMVTPKWVKNRIQPIAVRDALHYLLALADLSTAAGENRTFDIGGPDVMQYGEMMQTYGEIAGLPRRRMIVVPVLTPRLAGHWINLVTPVPKALAMPLIESLQCEAIAHESDIKDFVPPPAEGLTPYRRAVRLALQRIDDGDVETRWSNASVPDAPADKLPSDPDWSGETVYTDIRRQECSAPPEKLWEVVEGIGGENGWYSFPLAWSVRGWMDRLVGGVGLRRGRRDARHLYKGEALDWWRVEEIEPPRLLRLRAEMKVPGGAWLEMRVHPSGTGSQLDQRAVFFPKGLFGRLYWYSILPFHGVIFSGMVKNMTRTAERST